MIGPREVMTLPIAEIAIGSRIGFYDATHAAHLGANITAEGQHDPIHVKRNGNAGKLKWTLVAGLHRLRGIEITGRAEVDAIQVAAPGASAAELQRLELSENLDHRQRRPIERAILLVARARLEEEADYPGRVGEASQIRAGRARQSASAIVADASDWRQRTATAMGCSLRSLERYQRIHRAIVVELVDEAQRKNDPQGPMLPQMLNFHPLGESFKAMDRVAGLNPDARFVAAKAIVARPDATSIDQVLVEAGVHEGTGRRLATGDNEAQFLAHWSAAPLRVRRGIAIEIATTMPPTIAEAMIQTFKERGLLS